MSAGPCSTPSKQWTWTCTLDRSHPGPLPPLSPAQLGWTGPSLVSPAGAMTSHGSPFTSLLPPLPCTILSFRTLNRIVFEPFLFSFFLPRPRFAAELTNPPTNEDHLLDESVRVHFTFRLGTGPVTT